MREQVLKQAGSNGRAEVGVSVGAPLPCEAPYFFRVLLDIILNTEDRLPSWIRLAVGRHLSWENPLCFSYGLEYGHCFSQRYRSATARKPRSLNQFVSPSAHFWVAHEVRYSLS